jgi:hypothetical protein
VKERMFPILGDETLKAIPWAAIAPHDKQAQSNHSQTLEELARRGGLDVTEAEVVMLDRKYRYGVTLDRAEMARSRANLMKLVWVFERERETVA